MSALEREQTLRVLLVELREFFDKERGYEQLARLADALDAHETLDPGLLLDAIGE